MELASAEEDERAVREWGASVYIRPETGPGKSGHMEVVSRTMAEAFGEGHPAPPDNVVGLAQRGRWVEVAAHLLAHPADVHAHERIYALLHLAVLWEDTAAAAALLRMGADVNVRTAEHDDALYLPKNSTPLHLAAEIESEAMCRLLVCWGADPTLEDDWGRVPSRVDTSDEVRHILGDDTLEARGRRIAERARDLDWGPVFGMIESLYTVPLDLRASPTSDFFVLHHAIRGGDPYIYHLIVAAGASPLLRTAKTGILPSEVLAGQPLYEELRVSAEEIEQATGALVRGIR